MTFLVGVKNTGKSHIARKLAREMGCRGMDLDERVADLHASRSGDRIDVRAIYRLDAGATFRRLEAEACAEAANSRSELIVATGGGVCDNPEASAALRAGLVIALEGHPEFLFNRIMKRGIPAFMAATTRAEAWEEFQVLHRRRQALYRELSDVAVNVSGRTEDEIAADIRMRIEEHAHGGK